MYKKGDYVIFKGNLNNLPKNNLIKNKSYRILNILGTIITKDKGTFNTLLKLQGEKKISNYWLNYFYTKEELRKFKLNKIYDKIK